MTPETGHLQEQLGREVVQEIQYPNRLTKEILERWADMPVFADNDVENPEWRPTRTVDLGEHEGVRIIVKDESDRESNPTGTMKDRPAWEYATLYRDLAKILLMSVGEEKFSQMKVPRLTIITAGNEGRAIAECFKKHELPPPKLLVDAGLSEERLAELQKLRADVYAVDLSAKSLDPEEIKALTNNEDGVDITSLQTLRPRALYDWHVHEVMNLEPDAVYVPQGSGNIRGAYLDWQMLTVKGAVQGVLDPRLETDPANVARMNVVGAVPANGNSVADKLQCEHMPFIPIRPNDEAMLRRFGMTGLDSRVRAVTDDTIRAAQKVLQDAGVNAEPSGAAALALVLQDIEDQLIEPGSKVVAVNSGAGLDV